jgi:primosomal protein N' (replication factor Y) (superfamily II helicase)
MQRETIFADVILPQALPQLLTYRVPQILNDSVCVGQRVIVQLGKSKLLTGIVRKLHPQAPNNYAAKYIEAVLDEKPLIHETQLLLWEWIASYYCCTVGEVMNAALPSGLKLASETKFSLNPEWEQLPQDWNEKEEKIIEALLHRNTITIGEASEILQLKQVQTVLKKLIDKGALISEEELREKFKPKTADFVTLGPTADTEEKLQIVFADLEKRKAQKQSDALMVFLQQSAWDQGKRNEVPRLKLQEAAKVNSAVIAAMAEKNIFKVTTKEIGRLAGHLLASDKVKALSADQQNALEQINESFKEKDIALLHGITSSGKTEIYATLIEQCIKEKKQVLFLLPEIALTTQIINRLRKYFGKHVGVYHSGYSENERTEVWNKVLSGIPGECDIILGARSALFLPYNRLGLIIVDEEHEQSYKQHDPAPRYHARDTAIWLAKKFNAKVLLGSATPAIETFWNAKQNKYGLISLNKRYGGIELPAIEICDLRPELKAKTMKNNFSSHLINALQETLNANEQAILFQNRRGYTPLWECHTCGWIPQCTRCDVSLTYHKQANLLKCHYCGYACPPVYACNACGSNDVRMLGFGTEKIEEDLALFFPDVRVQRLDLDTTRSKSGYQKIISDFESGHTQILVGTQMVTKGLDFDNVSLVGIMNADKMLNYPDFRSIERGYQLMMQVAGRAGRKNKQGKVIIQTSSPNHWLLDMIKEGDYVKFYNKEITERHHYGYPPFVRMMRLTLKHKEDDVCEKAAELIGKKLKRMLDDKLLGPEKPYVPRINNYYLRQLLVKLDKRPESVALKASIISTVKDILTESEFKQIRLAIDVDPL